MIRCHIYRNRYICISPCHFVDTGHTPSLQTDMAIHIHSAIQILKYKFLSIVSRRKKRGSLHSPPHRCMLPFQPTLIRFAITLHFIYFGTLYAALLCIADWLFRKRLSRILLSVTPYQSYPFLGRTITCRVLDVRK